MFMKTKLNDFTVKGGISEQGSPIKLQNQLTVPVPMSLLKHYAQNTALQCSTS